MSHSTVGAVPITLPDGRTLHFRGMADRVDVDEHGGLHVVDYKTGRDSYYSGLSEENPDDRGQRVQLPVYGIAARLHQQTPDARVLAEYWFVSYKGNFRRIGYEITDAVLARVGTTLGLMVEGIEAGVFASHPTATSSSPFVECSSCDPDALGVTELRNAWERKRHDPVLSRYAQLAEPIDAELVEDEERELPGA
jgi:ATP-dependent helicase/nuclease subunit B